MRIGEIVDKQLSKVFDGVYECLTDNPKKSYVQAVDYVLKQLNIDFGERWFELMSHELLYADIVTRNEKRAKVLKAIADSGINVVCYGNIADCTGLNAHKNIECRGIVDFAEMMIITARAKITLNVLLNFRNGLHERVISAMINESISLTDSNIFLSEQFSG